MPRESDESLAAQLRVHPEGDEAHPVAVLLASHWAPVHDYATICVASSGNVASIVATAAFHQVLERLAQGEPVEALRPRLLVVVRDIVKAWSAQPHIAALIPELRKPTGGRGLRLAKSIAAENRKLAHRSFQTLPGVSQCLLWHTEVEAEPITVPAGLLGVDEHTASDALEQAREQFRAGCVRAHRELAPSKECRSYNRLLDVSIRRGDVMLPDVQQHLTGCPYCRTAAEQLGFFQGSLGLLLAETVLGWGARRYLDSRPGRAGQGLHAAGPGGRERRQAGAGRHRLLPDMVALGGQFTRSKRAKVLLGGLGLVVAALLVAMLAADLMSDDEEGPAASAGPAGSHTVTSRPTSRWPSPAPSATGSNGLPGTPSRARLRNDAAGLCLDIRGEAVSGAGTKMAVCSFATSQLWSYEDDGLLRNLADKALCLDSHAEEGLVSLRSCAGPSSARANDVRYDLTVQGELLPRWHPGLAVTPTSPHVGVDVAVKNRDGSADQKWHLDPLENAPRSRSVAEPPPSPKAAADGTHIGPHGSAGACAPSVSAGQQGRGHGDRGPSDEAVPAGGYDVRRFEAVGHDASGPVDAVDRADACRAVVA
ncbi:RICIN domain-containing protein [Streptomyces sp. NBC_00344]|uniref:RICIN domain-containing protein n=1 Tax=Streptomyces sp. NBC_00344 TaxID=2975720 RepID=UPI002E22F3E0